MKIEEMPVHNDDGSVRFTVFLDDEQRKVLLGFALNFLVASGLSATYGIMTPDNDETEAVHLDA